MLFTTQPVESARSESTSSGGRLAAAVLPVSHGLALNLGRSRLRPGLLYSNVPCVKDDTGNSRHQPQKDREPVQQASQTPGVQPY